MRTTGCAEPIEYKTGDVVKIFGRPGMDSSHDIVNVSYIDFAKDVKVGDHVLFDDGELDMLVIENDGPMLVAQVQNDGVLGAHKSVNVRASISLCLPSRRKTTTTSSSPLRKTSTSSLTRSCVLPMTFWRYRRYSTSTTAT